MSCRFNREGPVRPRSAESGFTLIELVIVVVILGILAAIAVVAVGSMTGTSAQAACKSDFKTVEVASESFKAETGSYPGGTPSSGYTITATSTPSGYMTGLANLASPTWDGVQYLMQTTDTDSNGNSIGPWLKDLPLNGSHYQIALSSDGTDNIAVYTTGSSPSAVGTANAGIANCSLVK